MPGVERGVVAGLSALAGTAVVKGAWTRSVGDRKRVLDYDVIPWIGGVVEVDAHVPAHAERAVLFEGGLGLPHEQWHWVCQNLPSEIAYVKYNRPGYGLSSPALHTDIETRFALIDIIRAHCLGGLPTTLVGYSYGGYLAAAYAGARRGEEPGLERLVLIDATHIEEMRSFAGSSADFWSRQSLLMEIVWAALGLNSFVPAVNRRETYTDEVNRAYRAFMAHPTLWATAYREYRALPGHPSLSSIDIPLDVVTAKNGLGGAARHRASQKELLRLSPQARHHFIEGADHESLVSFPDYAARIASVISEPASVAAEEAEELV